MDGNQATCWSTSTTAFKRIHYSLCVGKGIYLPNQEVSSAVLLTMFQLQSTYYASYTSEHLSVFEYSSLRWYTPCFLALGDLNTRLFNFIVCTYKK